MLDASSGERLAWFQVPGRTVTVAAELYSADLRVKAVTTQTSWEIRPVPQPDEETAAQSLARTLQRTGLAFRGVELVAAP